MGSIYGAGRWEPEGWIVEDVPPKVKLLTVGRRLDIPIAPPSRLERSMNTMQIVRQRTFLNCHAGVLHPALEGVGFKAMEAKDIGMIADVAKDMLDKEDKGTKNIPPSQHALVTYDISVSFFENVDFMHSSTQVSFDSNSTASGT